MNKILEERLFDVEKTLSVLVTKQDYNAEFFAGLKFSIDDIKKEMKENHKKIFESYTTREEVRAEVTGAIETIRIRLNTLEKIIYSAVGLILISFLGVLVSQVFQ